LEERRRRLIMGGARKTSFFCCFSGSRYMDDDIDWSPRYARKIRPSDYDRGWWVGEPDVDRKATDFIAKYRSRFAE